MLEYAWISLLFEWYFLLITPCTVCNERISILWMLLFMCCIFCIELTLYCQWIIIFSYLTKQRITNKCWHVIFEILLVQCLGMLIIFQQIQRYSASYVTVTYSELCHIQNPSTFRMLAYVEPEAYQKLCQISKMMRHKHIENHCIIITVKSHSFQEYLETFGNIQPFTDILWDIKVYWGIFRHSWGNCPSFLKSVTYVLQWWAWHSYILPKGDPKNIIKAYSGLLTHIQNPM